MLSIGKKKKIDPNRKAAFVLLTAIYNNNTSIRYNREREPCAAQSWDIRLLTNTTQQPIEELKGLSLAHL